MALFINTNVASLGAQRSLATSGAELKTAMERLSSGKKINSAADDAAGFAIAERMTAQIRGLNMATKNANDGLSMLGVIENATNDVTDMLHRMRELAIQATNDTNGTEDRKFLQKEVAELIKEIDRVADQTQYNGQTVLDGSFVNKSIQVGTESGQKVSFNVSGINSNEIGTANAGAGVASVQETAADMPTTGSTTWYIRNESTGDSTALTFTAGANATATTTAVNAALDALSDEWLGGASPGDWHLTATESTTESKLEFTGTAALGHFQVYSDSDMTTSVLATDGYVSAINIESATGAQAGLQVITDAIEQLAGDRATYGALQNRLEYTVSNLMNVAEFTTAARSRIEDADFAAESARLAKAQVLQQTGTAMLAQANASSQLALSLIR